MNSANSLPPYRIPNYITSPRKISYERWLESPVMEIDNNSDDGVRKICFTDGEYYTHKHFIIDFYNDLITVLHNNKFNIENEKEFKRDIAIFIYRLSKERS